METGTVFIKDSKTYLMPKKQLQSKMAYKSKMNLSEKPIEYFGDKIPKNKLYVPLSEN